MHILVPIKRVIDYHVNIRVKADHSGVETDNVKMSMNPFDEIALEAAIQLKEQGIADKITVVSIGEVACQETLRTGLALGADFAVHIKTDRFLEPINIAKLLAHTVKQQQASLVITGKQAIDGDDNQVGQMLAALLSWSQATFASKIRIAPDRSTVAEVIREVDGGLTTVTIELPAVITADLRLNQPRYPSLPNVMKAKQKPLTVLELDQIPVTLKQHIEQQHVRAATSRQQGVQLDNVNELIAALREVGTLL